MKIEFRCSQRPGRVTRHIEGWIEGEQSDLARIFFKDGGVSLPELDPRLEGHIGLTEFTPGVSRCPFVVSAEPVFEGRRMAVGDQVSVEIGGQIWWK